MTRAEALALLQAAGVADPLRDLRRLERFAAGDSARFAEAVAARAARRPLAQITGRRAFWKHEFLVTPDVLDPRPETEALIACALEEPFETFLDLGTGSGAIAISLLAECPGARGLACDLSEQALLVAGENAARIGVAERLTLSQSDWFDALGGRFDLIVSNPPYIAAAEMAGLAPEVRDFEPRCALTDEGDGLSAYRAIAKGAPDHLRAGGRLIVEIGARQGPDVAAIFTAQGLEDLRIHPDLDGRDRVVSARAPAM